MVRGAWCNSRLKVQALTAVAKGDIAGMAMALNGMSRQTLRAIATGAPTGGAGYKTALPPEVAAAIKKAYFLMENLWENYMQNGKVNPVAGIFLGKNNYHSCKAFPSRCPLPLPGLFRKSSCVRLWESVHTFSFCVPSYKFACGSCFLNLCFYYNSSIPNCQYFFEKFLSFLC